MAPKVEQPKPVQSTAKNTVKVEEKKQQPAKVEAVQKFEMSVESVEEPRKQDKSQNFMDALNSSFGEDSQMSSERYSVTAYFYSDGLESSKGGVNYYDFSTKPPNNPV